MRRPMPGDKPLKSVPRGPRRHVQQIIEPRVTPPRVTVIFPRSTSLLSTPLRESTERFTRTCLSQPSDTFFLP